jgi:hypothetical protein
MGVSVEMRPGTLKRSKGEPVDITPGRRSHFVMGIMVPVFGPSPIELTRDDLPNLELLALGESLHVHKNDSTFDKIITCVKENDACCLFFEW